MTNKSRPNDPCINARSNGRFYRRQAQWPFYQSRSNRTARPPDFRNKLQFRYYPAQSIYQRPGQAIFKQNPAQWPFYQRQVQWPFYQHQAQWPFYQGASNRMARPADLSRKLQFRYYLAQSIYQRPGQAIFKQKPANGRFINARSNGRFINARPTGRFIKVEATGRPESRPPDFSNNLQFRYYPAESMYQRPGQAIFKQKQANGRFINARPNGRFNNG